eukprot:jgi/Botrbrau1/23678/Bobra.55_2s0059.1
MRSVLLIWWSRKETLSHGCSWKRCSVDGFSHRLRTDAAVVPSLQVTPQAELLEEDRGGGGAVKEGQLC